MKRIMFVIVLAALLVATTGSASAAPTTRREFSGGWDICDLVDGTQRIAGHNWQDRGLTSTCETVVPGFPELTGTAHLGAGKWLEVGGPESWHDIMMGKERLEVPGGAWVGTWVFSPNADTIKIALNGEGQYAGWHVQMVLTPVYDESDPRSDILEGYIQSPGN